MTIFAVVAALMMLVALAWVVVPLMRSGRGGEVARATANAAIFRDQLVELDADLANGTLSRARYDQARQELERRVLEEAAEERAPAATGSGLWAAIVVAVAIPVVSGLLYLQLGNFDAFAPRGGGADHAMSEKDIEGLIAKLELRLAATPDPQGFLILARTYYALQRFPEAVKAYERAGDAALRDPEIIADYADALAVAQGRTLAGKPLELVKRALELDPNHLKSLALAGTEAFERKDYKGAIAYWERMQKLAPADSPFGQSIVASIAEARQLGGLAAAPATGTAALPAPVAAREPIAAGGLVAGVVTLAPALAARAGPDDTVFIFARAAEGPAMPLAILKRRVKDLPARFSLDDSQAMAPGMALSDFGAVVVGARVSRTATATPQTGDLEGLSKTVKVGATDVAVVIDKILP